MIQEENWKSSQAQEASILKKDPKFYGESMKSEIIILKPRKTELRGKCQSSRTQIRNIIKTLIFKIQILCEN
jgi:transcription elongation factor GreA-like protein